MSREYPDWISPARAAEGKRVFSGTIPLARMQRLAPLLADAQGEARFTARFSTDLDKRVVVELQVRAALPLVCQASLDVYDEQVEREALLAVIEGDDELDNLPEAYEPVRTDKGRLELAGLVEDELLLGLPQIPRKPGLELIEYSTRNGGEDGPGEPEGKKPFAALKDMLKQHEQD